MKGKIFASFVVLCLAVVAIVCGAVFSSVPNKTIITEAATTGFQYKHGDITKTNRGYIEHGHNTWGINYIKATVGSADLDPKEPANDTSTDRVALFSRSEMDQFYSLGNFKREVDEKGALTGGITYNSYGFVILEEGEKVKIDTQKEKHGIKLGSIEGADTLTRYGTYWKYYDAAGNPPVHYYGNATGIRAYYGNEPSLLSNTLYYQHMGDNRLFGMFDKEGFYEFLFTSSEAPDAYISYAFSFYIIKNKTIQSWPNKIFRVNDDLPGGFEEMQDQRGNQFYNNFADQKKAYIEYDPRFFEVDIDAYDASGMPMDIPEEDKTSPRPSVDRVELGQIGSYVITSKIKYKLFGAWGNYTDSVNRLSVYGVEAFYENYDLEGGKSRLLSFGGKYTTDGKPVDANVTGKINTLNSTAIPNASNWENHSGNWTGWSVNLIHLLNNNQNFVTATTNSPPVSLQGNVQIKFGVVLYNRAGVFDAPNSWVRDSGEYQIGKQFTTPGLYFIVLKSLNQESLNEETDIQCFYFRITNYINPRVQVTYPEPRAPEMLYFNDYAANVVNLDSHTNAIVFVTSGYNGTLLGPYEVSPTLARVTLTKRKFTGEIEKPEDAQILRPDSHGQIYIPNDGRFTNGIYIFTVEYGNNFVSMVEFVLVVDDGVLQNLDIFANVDTHKAFDLCKNFKYFGGNDPFYPTKVNVAWDRKASDQDTVRNFFTHNSTAGKYNDPAQVEFYPFEENENYYVASNNDSPKFPKENEITGINFNAYTTNTPITGGYWAKSKLSMTPVKTDYPIKLEENDKWYIHNNGNNAANERMDFTLGGLYIITVTDTMGVSTTFGFIIDNTEIGFAQIKEPVDDANIVDDTNVIMGFGARKVILATDGTNTIYSILDKPRYSNGSTLWRDIQPFITATEVDMVKPEWGVINIGIDQTKNAISDDGFVQTDVSFGNSGDYYVGENKVTYAKPISGSGVCTVTLKDEGSYFLRSTDVVGNVAKRNVWLNRDKSRMQVVEDNMLVPSGVNTTATLVMPDGMANMNYVTLRFVTSAPWKDPDDSNIKIDDMYVVDEISMQYYEFDFDASPGSTNYPFASSRTAYTELYHDEGLRGETVNISIMPNGAKTPGGLYVISRKYTYSDKAYKTTEDLTDTKFKNYDKLTDFDRKDAVRNYFFIVDQNEVIPFRADPFTSEVEMMFGNKKANYLNFRNPEPIHTNADADLYFPRFGSKYGSGINFSVPYKVYKEDGSYDDKNTKTMKTLLLVATVMHNERPLNGGKKLEFNESTWKSTTTFTQDGLYVITIRDGSGGIKPMPITGGTRQVQGNSAEITFDIEAGNVPVFWYRNGEKIPPTQEFSQFADGDKLEFGVENLGGASNFFAEINDMETVLTLGDGREGHIMTEITPEGWWERNGQYPVYENVIKIENTGNLTIKKYDVTHLIRLDLGQVTAEVHTVENPSREITRKLFFDNEPPKWNLATKTKDFGIDKDGIIVTNAIKMMDTLYADSPKENNKNYVYPLPNNFVFNGKDPSETALIEYREVNENLVQITGDFTRFNYWNKEALNMDTGRPFSSIVNLAEKQNRFFNIREWDIAGNCASYYVKLRDTRYVEEIPITGSRLSKNLFTSSRNIFGTDIGVGDLTAFWDANPNFKFSYTVKSEFGDDFDGPDFFRYKYDDNNLKNNYNAPTAMKAFEGYLNQMLLDGRGKKISFTYDDGFGAREKAIITQATVDTPRPQVITSADEDGNLRVEIKNREDLVKMFAGLNFYIEIYTIENKTKSNLPILKEEAFPSDNFSKTLSADQSYVIVIRDDFNRFTFAEHHSDEGLYCNIIFNGNDDWKNGIHYVGHASGVRIEWNDNTYNLVVDGFAIEVNGAHRGQVTNVRGDIWAYSVHPNIQINDQSEHIATLNFRISGGEWNGTNRLPGIVPDPRALPDWPALWTFYHVLPELQFRTINGMGISPERLEAKEGIKGMVEVTLDRRGFLYGSNIRYRLTNPDGTTEKLQINRFATRFILDKPGRYDIEIENDLGATRPHTIIISEVDNLNYKIRHKENDEWVDLIESPELFDLNTATGITGVPNILDITGDKAGVKRNIPVYWFSSSTREDVDVPITPTVLPSTIIPASYSNGVIEVVPSLNHNRILGKIGEKITKADDNGISYTWKYYYLENMATHVRMYFVIGITAQIGAKSNLLLNGNPNTPVSGGHKVYSTIPKNGIWYTLESASAVKSTEADPRKTNVYYIEYSHNNVVGGRAFGADTVTIGKNDYGIIELRIRDWAGNKSTAFDGRDCYTVYNFSVPPLLIKSGTSNFETIIDEMVYNNSFTLTAITSLPSFVAEANDYYYIKSIRVWRDKEEVDFGFVFSEENKKTEREFTFTEAGRYIIECTYWIHESGGKPVSSTHTIQLVDSSRFMQSFMYSGASNISITAVTFGGRADITNQFGVAPLKNLYIAPVAGGEGRYTITFAIGATNLRPGYTIDREILIAPLKMTRSAVTASKAFGNEYKEDVSIMFKPIDVMRVCNSGTATLAVYRDGAEIDRYDISTRMTMVVGDKVVDRDINETITRTYGEVGQYTVVVTASNGTTVFVDGFTITQASNTTMVYIGIGASIGLGIGVLLFIRLRSRMRVK